MTDKTSILLEIDADGIGVLTFNRPQARNALTLSAMYAFAEAVETLHHSQDDLKAVVLTGAGTDAFCAGGDLIDLRDKPTEAFALEFITVMGNALHSLESLPVPVIAAINGYALGGGSEIAVACDTRIVDDSAQMGFVQLKLGLIPGWGGAQRLMRLVGYARALDILIQARPMRAPELLALGLTTHIAPAGQALDAAMTYARTLSGYAPEVVRAVKAALTAGLTHSYDAALNIERSLFPPLWAAEAHLTAVENFMKKRRSS